MAWEGALTVRPWKLGGAGGIVQDGLVEWCWGVAGCAGRDECEMVVGCRILSYTVDRRAMGVCEDGV